MSSYSSWPDPTEYVAFSCDIEVDGSLDLFSALHRCAIDFPFFQAISAPDHMLLGLGSAAELSLSGSWTDAARSPDQLSTWLGSVPTIGAAPDVAFGATALGSLPFDQSAAGILTVPRFLLSFGTPGRVQVTVTVNVRHELAFSPPTVQEVQQLVRLELPGLFGRTSSEIPAIDPDALCEFETDPVYERSDVQYLDAVRNAIAVIRHGEIRKVVLSREVRYRAFAGFDLSSVLRRLRENEPTSTVFAIARGDDVFFGASPELLVKRSGDRVISHPLAGTVRLQGPPSETGKSLQLLEEDSKCSTEHRIVVEAISNILGGICSELQVPEEPSTVSLRSVAHLGTRITGRLRSRGSGSGAIPDALAIAAILHPTPAVAGTPTSAALRVLDTLESGDRGHYAGPVGWVDARGDGRFVIGIRSATMAGGELIMRAGAGIVEGSVPESELSETNWKLLTLLGAISPSSDGVLPLPAGAV